jgi:hypothetical protein
MVQKHQIAKLVERRDKLLALEKTGDPHPKQLEVLNAIKEGKKYIFIRAGRRSGKTWIATRIAWTVAGLQSGSICSIITPSQKQGKKIYWKKKTIQNFGPRDWVRKEQNDELTLFFHNGSYIEIDGSENIDAHRGDEKHLVILDEYKDIDPAFYSEVVEPMFATTDGIAVIIGTPPETPDSHYRELEDIARTDPDWAFVQWTSYDSPYISDEWLDKKRNQLARRGEIDVFKREYLAEYTKGGKNSVFPMFSRSLHMKPTGVVARYYEQIKSRCELYWLADPGTSSTFGCLFLAYYREKGQLLFLDEIYAQDKNETHTSAIVETAKQKMSSWEPDIDRWSIVYDDAAVWFANELNHQFGIAAFPAKKAQKKHEEGVSLFKELLLDKNTVIMTDQCENLAKEIENYVMVNGKYPLINDHLIDCVRYGLNFARIILALAENSELEEDVDDIQMMAAFERTGLPSWIQ